MVRRGYVMVDSLWSSEVSTMIVAELAKLSHRRACVRAATLALWTVLILFFGAQRSALGAYVATFEVEQATVIVQGA